MYEHYPHFFTATILAWKKLLQPDKYKQIIIESLHFLVKEGRIKVYAFVIMPNHIHLIWRILAPHTQENVQRDFLKFTAQRIKRDLCLHHEAVLAHFYVGASDRKYQFWERNPLAIPLYSLPVFLQKLAYIHKNPLQEKWDLAPYPEAYYYSSAKFYETGEDDFDMLSAYTEDMW